MNYVNMKMRRYISFSTIMNTIIKYSICIINCNFKLYPRMNFLNNIFYNENLLIRQKIT